jgi:hypothetical protein
VRPMPPYARSRVPLRSVDHLQSQTAITSNGLESGRLIPGGSPPVLLRGPRALTGCVKSFVNVD